MSLIISGISFEGSATASEILSTEMGVGSLFAVLALITLLAYLNLLDAAEVDYRTTEIATIAAVLPLLITFVVGLVSQVVTVL